MPCSEFRKEGEAWDLIPLGKSAWRSWAVAVHAFNISTREVEAGVSLRPT